EDGPVSGYAAQAGDEDQSTPVSGDGSVVYAPPRSAAASEAGASQQPFPGDGGGGGGRGGSGAAAGEGKGEGGGRRDRLGGDPPERIRGRGPAGGVRGTRVLRTGFGGDS